MNISLLSIYQNNIDLSQWLTTLPDEIDHLFCIVPIQDKHKIDIAIKSKIQITYLYIDNENFFRNLHKTLITSQASWFMFLPMHLKISTELYSEIKEAVSSNNNTLFIKQKSSIRFLGKNIKKHKLTNSPDLILFNIESLMDKTIYFKKTQKLSSSLEEVDLQHFDNFHLELDVQQQVLSYYDFLKKKKVYKIHFFTKPLATFLYRGIIKGAFLDGKAGFSLTYLYALASFKRTLFLWMKYKNID